MSTEDTNSGDTSTNAMSTLEKRYRRIIRSLPKAYRADRGEEMLTALLDGAAPGRTRPKPGEVFSLGALAVRLRFGAPGASARGQLTGDIVRRAVLVSLMVGIVLGSGSYAFTVHQAGSAPGLALLGYRLLQPVLFLALLFGWRRVGRSVSAIYLVINAIAAYAVFHGPFFKPVLTFLDFGLAVVTMLAVFPAFHREAPRFDKRRWWLLLCIVPSAAIACIYASFTFGYAAAGVVWPLFYAATCLTVATFAIMKFKSSPVWPVALAIGIWPLLMTSIEGTDFPFRGDGIGVAASCAAEVVAVAAVLASVVYRRRAVPA